MATKKMTCKELIDTLSKQNPETIVLLRAFKNHGYNDIEAITTEQVTLRHPELEHDEDMTYEYEGKYIDYEKPEHLWPPKKIETITPINAIVLT